MRAQRRIAGPSATEDVDVRPARAAWASSRSATSTRLGASKKRTILTSTPTTTSETQYGCWKLCARAGRHGLVRSLNEIVEVPARTVPGTLDVDRTHLLTPSSADQRRASLLYALARLLHSGEKQGTLTTAPSGYRLSSALPVLTGMPAPHHDGALVRERLQGGSTGSSRNRRCEHACHRISLAPFATVAVEHTCRFDVVLIRGACWRVSKYR